MTIHLIDSKNCNGKVVSTLLWCLGKNDAKKYSAMINGRSLVGNESEVVSTLVAEGWKGEIVKPRKEIFISSSGKSVFLKCNRGVQEGALYLLSSGILFLKPVLFLPSETVSTITAGRGGCATTRYIDLKILTDDGMEFEFSNIDREELLSLQQYVGYFTELRQKAESIELTQKEVKAEGIESDVQKDVDEACVDEDDESDDDYNPDSDSSDDDVDDDKSNRSLNSISGRKHGIGSESSDDSDDYSSDDSDDDYASEDELPMDTDLEHLPSKRSRAEGSSNTESSFKMDLSVPLYAHDMVTLNS